MDNVVVEFDIRDKRVLRARDTEGRWWRLMGHCLRCGKCCSDCEQLKHETLNGRPQAVCAVHWVKPWHCAVSPNDPHESLVDGCGYWWEPD